MIVMGIIAIALAFVPARLRGRFDIARPIVQTAWGVTLIIAGVVVMIVVGG